MCGDAYFLTFELTYFLLLKQTTNMYLFFDVSAEGKPKNWKAAPTDAFNWPRMVHLSWLMYNEERELIDSRNDMIKPEGFEISVNTEQKHKIDPVKIHEEGTVLKEALQHFSEAIDKAEYVIAHNMTFNANVVAAECYRKSISHRLFSSEQYCLMQEATWFCKIKGSNGRFKWPTLPDIHQKLYDGKMYADAGEAQTDVATCAICFFHLLDIDAIELF